MSQILDSITQADLALKVNKSGDTMTGNLQFGAGLGIRASGSGGFVLEDSSGNDVATIGAGGAHLTFNQLSNGYLAVGSAGAVLTNIAPNVQTGTSYTLAATDNCRLILFNNASAITVTLPQQSTLATADGFWCKVRNLGSGTITFIKQGAETLDGNTTLIQYGEVLIGRPTTTKWSIAYGTAVVNMPAMGTTNLSITTSQIKDLWCPQAPCTLLGIRFRAFSVSTAGTFKLQLNGVDIAGLTGLVPSTTQTIASVSSSVALATGDVITIVADGTLVTISDLNITPNFTVTY
jgi:hypothetical protein